MTRDEAIEVMAKERSIETADMEKFICSDPAGRMCDSSHCAQLVALMKLPPERAAGQIPALSASYEAAPQPADIYAAVARGILPDDDKARLDYPMADGLLYYFPAALAEVARVSKIGNDQHNPGQPLHWARSKSTDHENKILRHLLEAGTKDSKGVRHSARLAWRALALLQVELEREEGAPFPKNAKS